VFGGTIATLAMCSTPSIVTAKEGASRMIGTVYNIPPQPPVAENTPYLPAGAITLGIEYRLQAFADQAQRARREARR
jgi:hypothetical protein